MNKILPIYLFTSLVASAQISIDLTDMPVVGDVIYRKADTMTVLAGPGNAGANQTWIFTQTSNYVNDETSTAVAPSSTPYASQFSSSNLALTDGNGGYIFFNQSANSIIVKGIAGPLPGTTNTITAPLNPDQTLHNLPRTYNSNFIDTYSSEFVFDGSSFSSLVSEIKVKRSGTVHDTTDAWGSLTTPFGAYDVIRVKKIDYTFDSVWVKPVFPPTWSLFQTSSDTVTTYQWLAKSGKLPVAEMTFDSLGAPKIFRWKVDAPASLNDLLDSENGRFYPNPVNDQLTIELKTNDLQGILVDFIDLQGRTIEVSQVEIIDNQIKINTLHLPNGLYHCVVSDKNKQMLLRQKLTVIH